MKRREFRKDHGDIKYIDLKTNGKLFPIWVMHNFKKYKLPEVIRSPDIDPCIAKKGKKELRKYQEFIVKYMDYHGPYKRILLFHGLGSGKTAISISVYNMLFNYTPEWNVFILIRAALRDDPWLQEINEWLEKDDRDLRFKNIKFVHYDSPFADRDFMNEIAKSDSSKKNFYIIDEAHNFIRNVYSNINSLSGRRASTIYNRIMQDVRENDATRIIMISGTPAINVPYELALVFNLLRPGIFPTNENAFNQKYVLYSAYSTINPLTKNKFMRKIMGLVSYYVGATPDTHATSDLTYVDIPMDKYQQDVYEYYENIEEKIESKARSRRGKSSGSSMYKSYTRQASNFVFPYISLKINGENRPRPNSFRISEKEAVALSEGEDIRLKAEKNSEKFMNITRYIETIDLFMKSFDNWLKTHSEKDTSYTIQNDVKNFIESKSTFEVYWNNAKEKSNLLKAMYQCSPKFVYIIMTTLRSLGSCVVYTNYVQMEGIAILKIYLKYFGFKGFKSSDKISKQSGGGNSLVYGEFHGGIKDKDERKRTRLAFNDVGNIKGQIIKLILFSPAGTEGINLANVRQMHIVEPYWNEVRIRQMIGRAIRQCSHKDLPMQERHVEVFRYKMTRSRDGKVGKETTDEFIENVARNKDNLLQSFYMAIKEVAVDCELDKAHNMMNTEYKCFKFEENYTLGKAQEAGPAYKEDDYEDDRIESGSYSVNSYTKRIKVIEIKAVKVIEESKYSDPEKYWLYPKTGVVYDFDLKYPVGKVSFDESGVLKKLDKDTYIIDYVNPITEKNAMY